MYFALSFLWGSFGRDLGLFEDFFVLKIDFSFLFGRFESFLHFIQIFDGGFGFGFYRLYEVIAVFPPVDNIFFIFA